MLTISSGDTHINVRDEGPRTGRALVFANSLGTDMRVFDALVPLLPQGLRLVRFDKRGHGLSDAPPHPYAMEDLVGDAENICAALGLSDITFIGLSIGGLIGQGLAARRPDLVKALVLMDTAAKIGTADMWQSRIETALGPGIETMADGVLQRWFTESFRKDSPEFPAWRNMLLRTPAEGYAGCCAAISGADYTEATRALRLPVLALAGDQDGSTPPDLVRQTAELCNADFQIIAGAGHLPCVEKPAETARLIADFLKRTG